MSRGLRCNPRRGGASNSSRMFRGLRYIALTFLAATFLFFAVLWARTPWRTDFLGYSTRTRAVGLLSSNGIVRMEYFEYPFDHPGVALESRTADPPNSWDGELRQLSGMLGGLKIGKRSVTYWGVGPDRTRHSLYVPHWLPLAITGLPFAIAIPI